MRLIDADALPIVTRGKNHHRKYVFADITDAPTIDAIPVEWLEAHAREYYEDWGEEPITVENALKMWQKEQEAR